MGEHLFLVVAPYLKRTGVNRFIMIRKSTQPRKEPSYKAYRQVVRNKGSAGVDGMKVTELFSYLENQKGQDCHIHPEPHVCTKNLSRGLKSPRATGKTRFTGGSHSSGKVAATSGKPGADDQIRTYVRGTQLWLPPRKEHPQAVTQSLKNINDGYQDIVDIDLKGFFDEVDHCTVLQLIYQRVKCPTTLRLNPEMAPCTHPVSTESCTGVEKEFLRVPQSAPLLSNILLDVLDKELDREKSEIRPLCADDFSIYTKSRRRTGQEGGQRDLPFFLRDQTQAAHQQGEKLGIRRPSNFELLGGHAFVPTYQKGSKGKYQAGGEEEQLGITQAKAQTDYQENQTVLVSRKRLENSGEVWMGWVNNYRLASIHCQTQNRSTSG